MISLTKASTGQASTDLKSLVDVQSREDLRLAYESSQAASPEKPPADYYDRLRATQREEERGGRISATQAARAEAMTNLAQVINDSPAAFFFKERSAASDVALEQAKPALAAALGLRGANLAISVSGDARANMFIIADADTKQNLATIETPFDRNRVLPNELATPNFALYAGALKDRGSSLTTNRELPGVIFGF